VCVCVCVVCVVCVGVCVGVWACMCALCGRRGELKDGWLEENHMQGLETKLQLMQ